MNLYTLMGQSRFPEMDKNHNPTGISYEYDIVDWPNRIVKVRVFKDDQLVEIKEPSKFCDD